MTDDDIELLDESLIRAGLSAAAQSVLKLEVIDQIGSTSEALGLRARAGGVHGVALLAEQQTAGRGRQGKPWESPWARNVYLTLAWEVSGDPQDLAGLSLAVGCALADELALALGCELALKWPNDLYLEGRKLGGILVDVTSKGRAASAGNVGRNAMTVLIGVGVNVAMPEESAAAIDQPFTDLSTEIGGFVSRNQVATAILNGVTSVLSGWSTSGFAPWRERWQQRDWLQGQWVTVSGSQALEGIARGVSEEGALRVETTDGLVSVWGGEASLRRREDSVQ